MILLLSLSFKNTRKGENILPLGMRIRKTASAIVQQEEPIDEGGGTCDLQ